MGTNLDSFNAPVDDNGGATSSRCAFDVLSERLAVAASHRNAADIALVDLVVEAIANESWVGEGIRHVTHFLTWQLGITNGEAHRLVDAANAYATHPQVMELFRSGRLTLTQATIAVSTEAHRDREIGEVAVVCTVHQLRRFTRLMNAADGKPVPDDHEPERSEFSFNVDADGGARGRFRLTPEDRQVVQAALDQARTELTEERKAADAATKFNDGQRRPVTGADTFLRLAERSIAAETVNSRRARYRVNIFWNLDSVLAVAGGRATYTDGTVVPHWLQSRLTCDSTFTPTFTKGGKPVSVGRSQHIVPERTRRLILQRDFHACRVPWCNNQRRLEVHHIIWWEHGGTSDTWNLAGICEHHHDAIHRGDLVVTGDADDPFGLEFRTRSGSLIGWAPPPPPPDPPPPPEPDQPYAHPLGERLDAREIYIAPPPKPPERSAA